MKYEVGKIYFTNDGREVEYFGVIDNGLVVGEIVEGFDHETGPWQQTGRTFLTHELFTEAPTIRFSKEIAALKEQVANLSRDRENLRSSIAKTRQEYDAVVGELNHIDAFKRLLQFVRGEITHYVVQRYASGWHIVTFDEYIADEGDWRDRRTKGYRLISLFGLSKDDLSWMVNNYRDGSGHWQGIHPCASLEEAQRVQSELMLADIELAKKALEGRGDTAGVVKLIARAMESGIPVSAADAALVDEATRQHRRDSIKRYEERIADLTAKVQRAKSDPGYQLEGGPAFFAPKQG